MKLLEIGIDMTKNPVRSFIHNFNTRIWLIGIFAVGFRLICLALSDAGVGEADATARVIYSLRWASHSFVFVPTNWPPLQFYIYGLALRIFPDPLYTPLLINIFFGGLLTVVLGYLVRCLTNDDLAGLLAGIMVCFLPLAIRYSLIAVPEVIMNFLIFLTLYLLLRITGKETEDKQFYNIATASLTMAAAEWTHLEAWFLMPIFSLLLWGQWRKWLIFVSISAVPIFAFVIYMYGLDNSLVPSEWMTYSYGSPDRFRQVLYYPALLVDTLSPALILLAVFGLVRIWEERSPGWKRQLFPLVCLLCLIPPYLTFVFAWNRTRPKEALLLSLFVIPYAAIGLTRLNSFVQSRFAKWTVIATAVGMLLILPYNWKYISKGGTFPIPRTSSEYRQLAIFFNDNVNRNDAIVFDHLPLWTDYYFAVATRRMPNKAFLTYDKASSKTAIKLRQFVKKNQPALMVLSKSPSTISKALGLKYNSQESLKNELELALGVRLGKILETEHVNVYKFLRQN